METDVRAAFTSLRSHFNSGATRSLQFRLQALAQIEKMVRQNSARICQALFEDLHKPKHEAFVSEVAVTLEEIAVTRKNLKKWMKPKRVGSPLTLFPAKSRIHYEPLGVALIIAPWNYPFQLAMAPLIGAIAAGNCAILKPSELTSATAILLAELIEEHFSPNYIRVVNGGIPETTALLELKFDHIFFTGSTPVGRIVMQAAANNLVPVTLELGGKSPVIVTEDADLDLAARRIVWGKYYNAGQTCVAPDYLYVHSSVAPQLLQKISAQIQAQFGANPRESKSYARIVNTRNVERLSKMIDRNRVIQGGEVDQASRYIAPTVMNGVTWADAVMQEEIFGPILPVMTYESLNEVFKVISAKPKPLAAYFFSKNKEKQAQFAHELSFGGGCINDLMVHLSNPHLPFGGVGESGMGRYHGKDSFLTFSHAKSVMTRYGILDLSARYAPYTDRKLAFIRRLLGR